MHFVTPQKSYGQHYLIDKSVLGKINSYINQYKSGHKILEIGPGMGALTAFLVKDNPDLTCVEVDRRCIAYLHTQKEYENVTILQADFLTMDLGSLLQEESVIVGNFPYNISSQIVFKILDHRDKIPAAIGMFQKEMARRIAAPHNNKEYGVISVLAQLDYDMEVLFDIPPSKFEPPPKVMSSVLLMQRKAKRPESLDYALFRRIVKSGFNQRRKMLRSALNQVLKKEYLHQEFFNKRAEQLSLQDFIQLTIDAGQHVQ